MAKKKRKYNTNLIKETLNYSANDIAKLYKIYKGTVRQWIKEGLPIIDNQKPYLVLGFDLKEFIKNRQKNRKQKCSPNELYCCKCRKPQTSRNNLIDIKILNERNLMIMGICSQCYTKVNKISTTKTIKNIQEIFAVQTIHNKDLVESNPSIVNTDIKKEILI